MRRRHQKHKSALRQHGLTIIENLIAISLVGIALAGGSRAIIYTMHSNQSARAYTALAADVQKTVDGYRQLTYAQLLSKISTNYSAITDGQSASETLDFAESHSSMQTTFSAVKTSNTAFPEAVKVSVAATQRRGKLGDATYTYETYIAQVR